MSQNSGSEIITLQFGEYANFIGTHWWNLQEAGFNYSPDFVSDINHDVLYREGLNHRKEVTFTPRMLLVDLKGSLGHLVNDLYDNISTEADVLNSLSTWPADQVETVKTPAESSEKTNEFQEDLKKLENNDGGTLADDVDTKNYNLEETVKYWSDFTRTRYHPRSVNLVQDYQHGSSEQPFDCFLQGTEVWKSEAMSEDWADKVRSYVEECDCLQGFQVLSDATDGFSGLCAASLQHLKDEYSSKAAFVLPLTPFHSAAGPRARLGLVNTALLYASLGEMADMFVPLSLAADGWSRLDTAAAARQLPLVEYNSSLPYHTSAILSALLETVSLSYRLRGEALRLSDLCSLLTPVGRRAVTASLALPWPMKHGQPLLECLEAWEGPLSSLLTPHSSLENVAVQAMQLRGIDWKKMFPKDMSNRPQSSNPAYSCHTPSDLLQYFLSCDLPRTAHRVYASSQPIRTVNPFPNLFHRNVSPHGCVNETPLEEAKQRVKQVPVMGGLHCCQGSGTMLSDLYSAVKRVNVKTLPALLSLDRTDYEETLETVISLSDNYQENHEL